MSQEVIEITEREVEVIEVVERGPSGPTGPQANINYTVVSSPQTLSNSQNIAADTSGGSFTLTLPASPNEGDSIDIFDYAETFNTNPLLIARNGERIESLEEDLIANVQGAYFTMIYTGSTRGWQILPRYGTSGGGGESILTNQGDTLYRGALVKERLPIGTAGQILKVNSTSTAPEWGAAPATGVTSVTGTAPIVSSGGATPAISISAATTSAAGSMSSADKTKLDGIASGAEVNVNADWNATTGDAEILNKPSTFPPSTHTHVAADITDFTSAVEAVSPPADWDTLANKPASFTPSLHGSTHHTGGTDAIAAHQINGQTIFSTSSAIYSADATIPANRARQLTISNSNASGINVTLPTGTDGTLLGDTYVLIGGNNVAGPITVRRINVLSPLIYETLATISSTGEQYRFRAGGGTTGSWSLVPVDSHTHTASQVTDFTTAAAAAAPVQSVNGSTGTVTVAVPSASTATPSALGVPAAGTASEFARGDHVHAMPTASDVGAVSDTDARLSDSRTPTSHASSHLPDGDDELFDQSLNVADSVFFENVTASSLVETADLICQSSLVVRDNANDFNGSLTAADALSADRTLTLPDADGTLALTSDIPTELTDLASTGQAAGRILAADGDDGAEWVDAPSGGGGGEVRSDFVSPYTYTGLAAAGTSESTASWTIRRSEFDAGGSFVATLTASSVKWDDRLTASYA
jgi:hypothetical protein